MREQQDDQSLRDMPPLDGMRRLIANTFDHFARTPALTRLMSVENIHFARHLKKMRAAYKGRRAALVEALNAQLGQDMSFDLQHGGMHIIGRLDQGADDRSLARAARASGYNLLSLSNLSSSGDAPKGLLLGFTNIPERQAAEAVEELRGVLIRA